MSERFSDEVLQRVLDAYVSNAKRSDADGKAAMRAVLEGHLAAHLKHIILSIEPTSLADTYSEDDDIISRTDVMEALGLLPKASDGLRHDSIKPTSGRLLSAKKVKKEQT